MNGRAPRGAPQPRQTEHHAEALAPFPTPLGSSALSPQRDLPDDYGWTPCDPAHAKSFSAVGYFFGQALQEAMPDVPIGLIEASWSGSPIKTWIPYEAAEALGGDFGKQAGERLARLALARTYGREDIVEAGPIPDPLVLEPGDKFGSTVHNGGVDSEGRNVVDAYLYTGFRNDKGGLKARDGGLIRGFQAKINGVWHSVEADEHVYVPESGETHLVQLALPPNTDPKSVTAVRYAWDDYPDCNLVNGDGLPCGPFELEAKPSSAEETHAEAAE